MPTADFHVLVFDQEPQPDSAPPAFEVEAYHHPPLGELLTPPESLAPRPQNHIRIGVLEGHIHPLVGPSPHRVQDSLQFPAGLSRLVHTAMPVRFGADLDHPDPL